MNRTWHLLWISLHHHSRVDRAFFFPLVGFLRAHEILICKRVIWGIKVSLSESFNTRFARLPVSLHFFLKILELFLLYLLILLLSLYGFFLLRLWCFLSELILYFLFFLGLSLNVLYVSDLRQSLFLLQRLPVSTWRLFVWSAHLSPAYITFLILFSGHHCGLRFYDTWRAQICPTCVAFVLFYFSHL